MRRLNWVLWMGLALSLAVSLAIYSQLPKQGYVDYQKLFQGFKGKQELEGQLNLLKEKHQGILDSLTIEINTIQVRIDPIGQDSLRKKQVFYQTLASDFSQIQAEEARELTNKIWLQINQYLLDYGKSEGYDYIFGLSQETTSLAYGKEKYDITEQVLAYLNKRYEGH